MNKSTKFSRAKQIQPQHDQGSQSPIDDPLRQKLFSPEEMQDNLRTVDHCIQKINRLFTPGTHKYKKFRYSLKEVALLLNLPVKVVRAFRDQGYLKCSLSGDRKYFYAGDIYKFLVWCNRNNQLNHKS